MTVKAAGTGKYPGEENAENSQDMEIRKAEFYKSSSNVVQCPADTRKEYAFIGRSNVGKSSLINMLVRRRNLAKTASKPGKTQLINHFLINDEWYLVDLPGYGYAQTSKNVKRDFGRMISSYILKRKNLVTVFVLVDSRHKPQKIDLEFMSWLGGNGVPFSIIFTKSDKLNSTQRRNCIQDYSKIMLETWESMPRTFLTSSENSVGREEVLEYIESLNCSVGL